MQFLRQVFHGKHSSKPQPVAPRRFRLASAELMEPRCVLSASPIQVGAVYIEEDSGTDLHGDTFLLSFDGGVADTQLNRVVINGDQVISGFGVGDVFFDTVDGALGADGWFEFTILEGEDIEGVRALVDDGGLTLTLEFDGFDAGDQFVFSIDVDEVEDYDPNAIPEYLNDGIDPITSGVEFQGSHFTTEFIATGYYDVDSTAEFRNRYDDALLASGLNLPPDNANQKQDRTAGAFDELVQEFIPNSISGRVQLSTREGDCFGEEEDHAPLEGVSVQLFDADGNLFAETLTDANGEYFFTGLPPGSYTVVELTPTELIDGGAAAGTIDGEPAGNLGDDGSVTVDLIGGQDAENVDFCEHEPATLQGNVYHDRDDDGNRESGEEGIGSVLVQLIDEDGLVVAETSTDAEGRYRFDRVEAGHYDIREIHPSDWIDGMDAAGTINGIGSGAATNPGDVIRSLDVGWGDAGIDYNFGEILPASIAGRVQLSTRDGDCFTETENHVGLAGVRVLLLNSSGEVVAETLSDADGYYEFVGLRPGNYTLVEETPEGLIEGGSQAGDVEGLENGMSIDSNTIEGIMLTSGDDGVDYLFCEHPPVVLEGKVYHDRDDDGVREPGEEGIAGVTIQLLDQEGNVVAETVTDESGCYRFENLTPGKYDVREIQPDGWLDGKDSVGKVNGEAAGQPDRPGDTIRCIELRWGDLGTGFDFGELLPGVITGIVHTDLVRDCVYDPGAGEETLAGVTIQLLDVDNNVIATTLTNALGEYRFEGLRPGTYTVRELQPDGYFDGGWRSPRYRGEGNRIGGIVVASGQTVPDQNFCEVPPGEISGHVFQDGAPVVLEFDEELPERIADVRDGIRTDDDTFLSAVVLQLRDGITGRPIDASRALPGLYEAGPISQRTTSGGFYQFLGLPPGTYSVYEEQPDGFIDGVDTPGTTSGFVFNPGEPANAAVLQSLEVDPQNNAIVRISLPPGRTSRENNFSELVVLRLEEPEPPVEPPVDPPVEPPVDPPVVPPLIPPPVIPEIGPPEWVDSQQFLDTPPLPQYVVQPYGDGSDSTLPSNWHLSVIDGGRPRGNGTAADDVDNIWRTGNRPASELKEGTWQLPSVYASIEPGEDSVLFGLEGAIPFAADFNGDGYDEIGVYLRGEWFIDINANGKWDDEDLWARLGDRDDLPVTGDWDGDGKADIGIFGRAWEGDARAIAFEAGLPDTENVNRTDEKNLPPEPKKATSGRRVMQLSAKGKRRADAIDHVFHFGSATDLPVVADWNGDGIASIGVFRKGQWHVDVNGDGRWSDADRVYQFGQAGDLPLTGDFNGDGIDDIAVYRDGKVYLDSNGNHRMDAKDKQFEKGRTGDHAVAGDFNGDGVDEIATYRGVRKAHEPRLAETPLEQAEAVARTAMKDAG